MDEITAPSAGSAETLRSPLSVMALGRLFFSPTEYFQSAPLNRGHAWLLAAWISGISSVIDRVDQRLLRSDLGNGSAGNEMGSIVDSWLVFWGLLLAFGVLWAAWNWWIGFDSNGLVPPMWIHVRLASSTYSRASLSACRP